jgi:hypothetical protein
LLRHPYRPKSNYPQTNHQSINHPFFPGQTHHFLRPLSQPNTVYVAEQPHDDTLCLKVIKTTSSSSHPAQNRKGISLPKGQTRRFRKTRFFVMASFSQDDGLLDDDSQLPDEIDPPPKPRPLPRQCLPRLILTGGGVRQQEDDSPFSAQEAMASMLPPNTPLTTDGRWPPSRVFWCVSRACYARVPTLRARAHAMLCAHAHPQHMCSAHMRLLGAHDQAWRNAWRYVTLYSRAGLGLARLFPLFWCRCSIN